MGKAKRLSYLCPVCKSGNVKPHADNPDLYQCQDCSQAGLAVPRDEQGQPFEQEYFVLVSGWPMTQGNAAQWFANLTEWTADSPLSSDEREAALDHGVEMAKYADDVISESDLDTLLGDIDTTV